MFRKLIIFIILFVLTLSLPMQAQQIGINWEFNQDGDAEGWAVDRYLSDFSVSNGMLQGIISGFGNVVGSSFSGPNIDINASVFGYVSVRMKAHGATSGSVLWLNDANETGGVNFSVINDTLFHVYDIPVYTHSNWVGQITQFQKLTIKGDAGTEINIDYIQIVSVGPRFGIQFFKPLRTVLKQDDQIPLIALIQNVGDRSGSAMATLVLPDEIEVVSEGLNVHLSDWDIAEMDTLQWIITSQDTGDFQFTVRVTWNDSNQCESSFQMPITDRYWKPDGLVVSTWGNPEQTEEGISEYLSAHFNTIVRIAPDESQVQFMADHGLKCMIDLFGTLGGTPYLRGFDREPAYEITKEILAQADPIIERFKNNPSVFGYHICDEPCTNAFENLGMVVSYLREKDPDRLAYINLYPSYGNTSHFQGYSYEEYVARFMDVVRPELLSYDHYNFLILADREDYFLNLEVIRKNACLYDIPFCNIVQGEGATGDNWRTPTNGEFRFLNYSTLAYGGKWIVYFLWPRMKIEPNFDSVIYPSVQELNQEVLALSPVLSELRSEAVFHTNTIPLGCRQLPSNTLVQSISDNANFVIGYMQDKENNDYIMLMNKNTSDDVTKSVTLNRKVENLQCFDVEFGEWRDVSCENTSAGTKFTCAFRPGGGKLFLLGKATSAMETNVNSPCHFQLYQNYPNPFNPATSISYSLSSKQDVELKVFNLLGSEVATLVNKTQQAGAYRVFFDASHLANGVYFYQLKAGVQSVTHKMMLMK